MAKKKKAAKKSKKTSKKKASKKRRQSKKNCSPRRTVFLLVGYCICGAYPVPLPRGMLRNEWMCRRSRHPHNKVFPVASPNPTLVCEERLSGRVWTRQNFTHLCHISLLAILLLPVLDTFQSRCRHYDLLLRALFQYTVFLRCHTRVGFYQDR